MRRVNCILWFDRSRGTDLPRRNLLASFLALVASCLLAGDVSGQSMRFGVRVSPQAWEELRGVLAISPCDVANPIGVTLVLPREWAVDPDWASFDSTAGAVAVAGARLTVSTQLPSDPTADTTLAYLATLSEHSEKADTLALDLKEGEFQEELISDPDRLAFALKRLTVALRGSSRAEVLLGDVRRDVLPIAGPLYGRDMRAYLDGYTTDERDAMGGPNEAVVKFLETNHPGAPFLVHLPKVRNPIAAQLLVLSSASRGASFSDIGPESVAPVWGSLVALRSHLPAGMSQGYSVRSTEIRDDGGSRQDIAPLNFLDGERFVQAMALVPTKAASPAARLQIHLPTADVSAPQAYLLPDFQPMEVTFNTDSQRGETILSLQWQGRAMILFFSRLKTGTVGLDQVSVAGTYRVPVELIIARHQAVQQVQDTFLDNYRADARVDYHFKLPGGTGSLDVTFLNDFFYQKGRGATWVQNEMLINGVKWKGGTIPNLPIIEPEKVNILPLTLTIGRDYEYRYLGEEVVDGRPCFVVDFVPSPSGGGSLYSGKVWIDRETYVRRRMRVRQTGLEPPVVSNDETDEFGALAGAGGRTFHLLTELSGQMIFSIAGANITAERKITFTDIRPNAPDFSAEMKSAEGTDKSILTETARGLRYLVKGENGSRKLQLDPPTGKWFAVAGAYYDQSLDFPLPLVGANYFDYDFKKKKMQVEMLLTGVANTLTVARVDILPKVDGSANAILFAVPFPDKVYLSGQEERPLTVKVLRERLSASLGWRFQELSKLSLEVGAEYKGFSKDKETSDAFRLPEDHTDYRAALGYRFSWRGWTLAANYEAHGRSAWSGWGIVRSDEDVRRNRSYTLWDFASGKSFHLPYFQKISAGVSWMDGKDLDRFSKYQFLYMGRNSLAGFAGSGVRFDRGGVARLAYDFSVADAIRFGVKVERARVQPVKGDSPWQNHTGTGISGAITGPWKTYWTLDAGYSIQSDIPGARRKVNISLGILKLW